MIKNTKIYKKLRNYISEVLGYKYQLFHRKALLKLKYKVEISKNKTNLSNNFYSKILKILNKSKNLDNIEKDSLWLDIFNKYHKNFINIISKDNLKLKQILDNPSKYNLFFGFDNNCEYFLRRPRYIDLFENNELVVDKILNLAEYLGILRHNNPEHFRLKFSKISIDDLLDRIEEKLHIELNFKNVFPGEEGIKTKRGIISNREIQALYQAYKIKEIFRKNNYESILEIGGGLGRTAYYCNKFGIKNYTLTDLIIPRICQLNYLSRVLNEKIVLDESELQNQNLQNCIKVISPEFLFKNNNKFDLVFNSDSLTEIDYLNQKKYSSFISNNSNVFYSINHESNEKTINDLFINTEIKEYEKNMYWLRKGYLEEYLKFK